MEQISDITKTTAKQLDVVGEDLVCDGDEVWMQYEDKAVDVSTLRAAIKALEAGVQCVTLNERGDTIEHDSEHSNEGQHAVKLSIGRRTRSTNIEMGDGRATLVDLLNAAEEIDV